jgi:hypothetical protein
MKARGTVLRMEVGDGIEPSQKDFRKLSGAFFADLEKKFT